MFSGFHQDFWGYIYNLPTAFTEPLSLHSKKHFLYAKLYGVAAKSLESLEIKSLDVLSRAHAYRWDLKVFKGDVHKGLGELATRMEKGFGDIITKLVTMEAELKYGFRFTKWQVHLIFGGTTVGVLTLYCA